METYKLTDEERKLLAKIAKPLECGGVRLTRPVIIAFSKQTGIIAGLSSLTQWRGVLKASPEYKNAYRFELHNMW